jgi:hypothetical protein
MTITEIYSVSRHVDQGFFSPRPSSSGSSVSCTESSRIPDTRIEKFPSQLIRIKSKKLLSTVSSYLFRCLF